MFVWQSKLYTEKELLGNVNEIDQQINIVLWHPVAHHLFIPDSYHPSHMQFTFQNL
jgi:hypothetical protein